MRFGSRYRHSSLLTLGLLLGACSPTNGIARVSGDALDMETQTAALPLAYQDIERIQVLCLLKIDGMVAAPAEADRLCAKIASGAEEGIELPVSTIPIGDPQVVGANRLTLLVHGSVTTDAGARNLAMTIRPYRADADGSAILFGATPRIVDFDNESALDVAIGASLDEVLPWRAKGSQVRRID